MKTSCLDLEKKNWATVENLNHRAWRVPYSVHLPLHPPHSKTFVYMDCAGNAYTLPVLPDIRSHAPGLKETLAGIETMIVQFAFDTPAFVPDFRLSRLELAEGRYPAVKLSYYARELNYEIEYFCDRVDSGQNALRIRASITNEGVEPRDASIRVKLNFQKERGLFDYHYVPFYWDAGKWRPDNSVELGPDGGLLRNGNLIGMVKSGNFEQAWDESISFNDEEYDKFLIKQHYVQPHMRLKQARGLMRFNGPLEPDECKSFEMALLTEHADITGGHREYLRSVPLGAARQRAVAGFKSIVEPAERVQLTMPQDDMDKIFAALQVCNYQMLIDFQNGRGLQPCQGGSSERFYVWVWEAMCMMLPMLQLGHFEPVRRVIDFIFTLQDGGTPPDGKFTSLEGAVGTTGPRWINSTGSALALAAEYYRYSHDDQFLGEYIDKMLRAAFWIIGEIRATRKLNPDGSRPPVYGLLPYGRATDGDIGRIVAFSDAYSLYGLEKFSRLLQMVEHPRAAEVAGEVAQYKQDLDHAVDYMRRPDGFIDRKIVVDGDGSVIARGFNNTGGAHKLIITGVLAAQDPRFKEYDAYNDKNIMRGFFAGAMNRDIMYIGSAECLWQYAWLCMGQWKKAYSAVQTNLKYGMTSDAFLTQERFSLVDPAFTPWQPNSSGNGRLLEMIIRQFYFEYSDIVHGDTIVFFGGMPPAWFEINPKMALNGLYTPEGRISVATSGFDFTITCDGFLLRDKTIRVPEYLSAAFHEPAVESLGAGFFKIAKPLDSLSGKLSPNQ